MFLYFNFMAFSGKVIDANASPIRAWCGAARASWVRPLRVCLPVVDLHSRRPRMIMP
jgi:hypothetical protein